MDLLKAAPQKLLGQFRFRGGLGHQEQFEYDIADIMADLKVEFRRQTYSTSGFWQKMSEDINRANELMGEVRINLPQENVSERLKDKEDIIFKYKVYLYGKHWS